MFYRNSFAFLIALNCLFLASAFSTPQIIENPQIPLNPSLKERFQNTIESIYWNYNTIIVIETIDKIPQDDKKLFLKQRFFGRQLDKIGIPVLNLYILYVDEENKIYLITADSCGLGDSNFKYSIVFQNPPEYPFIKSQSFLERHLQFILEQAEKSISSNFNKRTLTCSLPTRIRAKPSSCKPLFDEDYQRNSRLRILFLGANFYSENEFLSAVNSNAIRKGFNRYQPFKYYSTEQQNSSFQFMYGSFNLHTSYNEEGFLDLESHLEILEEVSRCPETFLAIVIDKEWENHPAHSLLDGYYNGNGLILTSNSPEVIMHEVGHSFLLNDEYVYSENFSLRKNFKLYETNCHTNPSVWSEYLSGLKHDYVGCSTQELYRSSPMSLMLGLPGTKFNLISCMHIVKMLESVDLKHPKVYEICKKMYDSNQLEQNPPIKPIKNCFNTTRIGSPEPISLNLDLNFCNDGLIIAIPNLVIDCNNMSIIGPSLPNTIGILVRSDHGENFTLKNCNIRGFQTGIVIEAENTTIENTDLRLNTLSLFIKSPGNVIELVGAKHDYDNKIKERVSKPGTTTIDFTE